MKHLFNNLMISYPGQINKNLFRAFNQLVNVILNVDGDKKVNEFQDIILNIN